MRGVATQNRDQLIDAICSQLATGSSLLDICQQPNMPSRRVLYDWMDQDETNTLRSRIARARELGQDAEIERTIEMADAATAEDYNAVKLRIWARQWRASKIAPHRYGDRNTVELTGKDGGPVQQQTEHIIRFVEVVSEKKLPQLQAPDGNALIP